MVRPDPKNGRISRSRGVDGIVRPGEKGLGLFSGISCHSAQPLFKPPTLFRVGPFAGVFGKPIRKRLEDMRRHFLPTDTVAIGFQDGVATFQPNWVGFAVAMSQLRCEL